MRAPAPGRSLALRAELGALGLGPRKEARGSSGARHFQALHAGIGVNMGPH